MTLVCWVKRRGRGIGKFHFGGTAPPVGALLQLPSGLYRVLSQRWTPAAAFRQVEVVLEVQSMQRDES